MILQRFMPAVLSVLVLVLSFNAFGWSPFSELVKEQIDQYDCDKTLKSIHDALNGKYSSKQKFGSDSSEVVTKQLQGIADSVTLAFEMGAAEQQGFKKEQRGQRGQRGVLEFPVTDASGRQHLCNAKSASGLSIKCGRNDKLFEARKPLSAMVDHMLSDSFETIEYSSDWFTMFSQAQARLISDCVPTYYWVLRNEEWLFAAIQPDGTSAVLKWGGNQFFINDYTSREALIMGLMPYLQDVSEMNVGYFQIPSKAESTEVAATTSAAAGEGTEVAATTPAATGGTTEVAATGETTEVAATGETTEVAVTPPVATGETTGVAATPEKPAETSAT